MAVRDVGPSTDDTTAEVTAWVVLWISVAVAGTQCCRCCAWLGAVARRAKASSRATQPPPTGAEPGLVRFGIVGAATIAPTALIAPARRVPGVCVRAVAARSPKRAARFADKHGIKEVYVSYEALLADPDVDAVYNPLPNGLHAEWTLKALAAGKHVLCEKPFTSTAEQAEEVRAAASAAGRHVVEGFHNRYHPAVKRLREIVRSGELGQVTTMTAAMGFPGHLMGGSLRRDIRMNYDLGGGCLMDFAYTVNILRYLADGEEPTVTHAHATLLAGSLTVDTSMQATLRFPTSGIVGVIDANIMRRDVAMSVTVQGDKATLKCDNFVLPTLTHTITVNPTGGSGCCGQRGRTEHHYADGGASTYDLQLAAFVRAVRDGDTDATATSSVDEAVANMRVLDAIYAKAGLAPRASPPRRDGRAAAGAGDGAAATVTTGAAPARTAAPVHAPATRPVAQEGAALVDSTAPARVDGYGAV